MKLMTVCIWASSVFTGHVKIAVLLNMNRKRIRRFDANHGTQSYLPAAMTSQPAPGTISTRILLRDMAITRPNQVWAADITYHPHGTGFLYLVAIIGCFTSRYVMSWRTV